MALVKKEIESNMRSIFSPEFLEVIDESAMHAGHASAPAGGESHFRIRIKANCLLGKSRIVAHREIYAATNNLAAGKIHALAIELIK